MRCRRKIIRGCLDGFCDRFQRQALQVKQTTVPEKDRDNPDERASVRFWSGIYDFKAGSVCKTPSCVRLQEYQDTNAKTILIRTRKIGPSVQHLGQRVV
jgi:hypothetical protein